MPRVLLFVLPGAASCVCGDRVCRLAIDSTGAGIPHTSAHREERPEGHKVGRSWSSSLKNEEAHEVSPEGFVYRLDVMRDQPDLVGVPIVVPNLSLISGFSRFSGFCRLSEMSNFCVVSG